MVVYYQLINWMVTDRPKGFKLSNLWNQISLDQKCIEENPYFWGRAFFQIKLRVSSKLFRIVLEAIKKVLFKPSSIF